MDDERLVLNLQTTSIEDEGCFGILKNGSNALCLTLERTFDDVRPIIPAGTFNCVKTVFVRGGYGTFEITGVEGHTRLLFHRGNVETDSLGCILLGTTRGELNGEEAILGSAAAFAKFWNLVQNEDSFDLEVVGR